MISFPGNIRTVGTVDGAGNSPVPTPRNGFHIESKGLKTQAVVAHRLQRRRRGSPHPIRLKAIFPRSLPQRFRNPLEKSNPLPIFFILNLKKIQQFLRCVGQ